MIKWRIVTKEEYTSGTIKPDDMYFISDTGEIYKGGFLFNGAVETYMGDLPLNMAKNKLYINLSTFEGKIFDGENVITVTKSVDIIPTVDSINLITSGAVKAGLDEVYEYASYNAVDVRDVTVQSAPPNYPRNYTWHVDMLDILINNHDYDRYFYLVANEAQLDVPGIPNIMKACARWRIDGKYVFFAYLENGVEISRVDITDRTTGEILLAEYRPIPKGNVWYFGKNQAEPFPETDNIRSIIEINVPGINVLLGNTFNLKTEEKEIVGVINEVMATAGSISTVNRIQPSEDKDVSVSFLVQFIEEDF